MVLVNTNKTNGCINQVSQCLRGYRTHTQHGWKLVPKFCQDLDPRLQSSCGLKVFLCQTVTCTLGTRMLAENYITYTSQCIHASWKDMHFYGTHVYTHRHRDHREA